jgi:solute carrier family 25 thiamine pyrophosphate transporter 19
MRTQFAVQGKVKTFNSMSSYVSHTFNTYGIKGFYTGLGPAIVGVTPYVGLNFAIYETLKTISEKFHNTDDKTLDVVKKGLLGGLAGGSAKFLVYPLDTVKKRLQAQTLHSSILSEVLEGPKYTSMKDCFTKIFQDEGLKGFYRVRNHDVFLFIFFDFYCFLSCRE